MCFFPISLRHGGGLDERVLSYLSASFSAQCVVATEETPQERKRVSEAFDVDVIDDARGWGGEDGG